MSQTQRIIKYLAIAFAIYLVVKVKSDNKIFIFWRNFKNGKCKSCN